MKKVSRRVALGIGVFCVVLLIVVSGLLQSRVVSLQSQMASKDSAISSLNSTIGSLASQVSSLNAQVNDLEGQVALDNSTNAGLRDQLASENGLLSNEGSEVSSLKSDVGELSVGESSGAEVASLQGSVASLTSQLSSAESTISSLSATNANLDSTMANWESPVVDGFSVVQITDTQHLSEYDPGLFDSLTGWVVNNSNALNISMVVHTGDIVQNANSTDEWQNADNAMMALYDGGVPYCWDAGNHDFYGEANPSGNPDGSWIGGDFSAFNATLMQQEPYWVASVFDGSSTAVQFSYGNYRFMVVNVAYDANQTTLDWMQALIESNPRVNVIVATHNFLTGAGTYGYNQSPDDIAWAENFESVLNGDPNVIMTLNGHDINEGTAFNQRVGNREEIFFNRQEVDDELGAACARIYTFNMANPADPVVSVYTYQTYASSYGGGPQYLTDPSDQFNFTTNLAAWAPSTVSVPGGTDFVGASGFSVNFANSVTFSGFNQTGDALTFLGFDNLTVNGFPENFNVATIGADITVNAFNPGSMLSYAVSGGGGTQTFWLNSAPTSISGIPTNDWTYLKGELTIMGATSSVTINLR